MENPLALAQDYLRNRHSIDNGIHGSIHSNTGVHPPLWLEHRLDHVLGPAAQTQAHGVVRCAPQQALCLQILHHCYTRLEAGHACKLACLIVVDVAVVVKDVDELEGVALASGKIVGVMCGSHLQVQM